MSYAVIKTGGKQYKVKSGEILKIEKLPDSKPDSKIEFNEVLAYGDDKTIEIGAPTVAGAKVEADLIKNGKDRTILIFKKRRRHNSRRKNGHRQEHTMIRINKIFSKDGKVLSEAEKMVKPTKKVRLKLKKKLQQQVNKLGNLWQQKKQVDHRETDEIVLGVGLVLKSTAVKQ